MKKYICDVCGYIYEGDAPPIQCPICRVGDDKFSELGATDKKEEDK